MRKPLQNVKICLAPGRRKLKVTKMKKNTLVISLLATLFAFGTSAVTAIPNTGLTRLDNLGEESPIVFEVREKDINEARSRAKSHPMIRGRVRGIRNISAFTNDFNRPTFSIGTFKVLADGSEEWVGTSSHRYSVRKGRARFRIPLLGLESSTKYHFYLLTDRGAKFAGPFVAEFTPSANLISTASTEVNRFPVDELPEGFTETELDGIAKYILQRTVFIPQNHRKGLSSATYIDDSTNNFVVTIPIEPVKVSTYEKRPKINVAGTAGDDGTTAGTGGSTSISHKGAWDQATNYNAGDIVSSDSASFIAVKAVSAGQAQPTRSNKNRDDVTANWALLVEPITPDPTQTVIVDSLRPVGSYNLGVAYTKGDIVSFGGGSFVAQQDVPAGILPNPNDLTYWTPLAIGNAVLAEENVNLPGNATVQAANLSIDNPDTSTGAPASLITVESGNTNIPVTIKVAYTNGAAAAVSYELNGVVTNFDDAGSPVVPDSEAEAFAIPGHYYSFYVENNKLMLKNVPLGATYTGKTISVEYKAF